MKSLRSRNNNIKIGNHGSSESQTSRIWRVSKFSQLHFVDIRYVSYLFDVPFADFIVSHTEKPQSLLYVMKFTRTVKTRSHIILYFSSIRPIFYHTLLGKCNLQLCWCKTKHVSYILRKAIKIVWNLRT